MFQVRQEGVIGVRFPYDKTKVDAIKCIEGRRWNKENQEWLIPAAFLDQAVELLGGEWPLVPKEVVEEYEKSRAAGTRLIVGNTFTKIQGHDLPLEDIEEAASFWIEGAEYSKNFRMGSGMGRSISTGREAGFRSRPACFPVWRPSSKTKGMSIRLKTPGSSLLQASPSRRKAHPCEIISRRC
ncbi:MAG: hypothetical protein IPI28_04795 [Candidatus Omnitrophica bacterium]|nr:hypothetical protein [Candidatus Omnitrophota bacterium]